MSKKASNPKTQEPAGDSNELEDQSLNRVRDILFGAEVRDSQKRFELVEELIARTSAEFHQALEKQNQDFQNTIDSLSQRLAKQAEQNAQEIDARFNSTLQTIQELESSSNSALNETAEQLSFERDELEKRAVTWNEELAQQLDTVNQQLIHRKADRSVLSSLLTNMADSLMQDEPNTAVKN